MGRELVVLSNRAGESFAKKVFDHLKKLEPKARWVDVEYTSFDDGEGRTTLQSSVRGTDAYVIQCALAQQSLPENKIVQNMWEHLSLTRTLKTEKTAHITSVIPYCPFLKQDKQRDDHRDGLSAELWIREMKAASIDGVFTMDLHAAALINVFHAHNIYPDVIPGARIFHKYIIENVLPELRTDLSQVVVFSPDTGGISRAAYLKKTLGGGAGLGHGDKFRFDSGRMDEENYDIIGNVNGKHVIIYDDQVATAGTVRTSIENLMKHKPASITFFAPFGLNLEDELTLLKRRVASFGNGVTLQVPGNVEEEYNQKNPYGRMTRLHKEYGVNFVFTNVIESRKAEGITFIDVSQIIARGIYEIHNDGSMTSLKQSL